MSQPRSPNWSICLCLLLLILPLTLVGAARPQIVAAQESTYTNPLPIQIPGGGVVQSCADPTILHAQDSYWYIYCTSDPLNDQDRNADGSFKFHLVPTLKSSDLVNWTYAGDGFDNSVANGGRPAWAEPDAGIWAPEVAYSNGVYSMYFVATDVKPSVSGEPADCHGDSAIGLATSASPTGPWTYQPAPVVAPRRNGPGCNFFWTYDPDLITAQNGAKYLYYGSYYGGIFGQPLSADGRSVSGTPTQITIANRYEGAEVVYREGYYYLFVSATNCCNGPLTAYSVFAGRSNNPLGPFKDREGVSLLQGQVGGTPVIVQNGNRWVGAGHNSVFQDMNGQWWTIYHAVDRFNPYFADAIGFTKRPVLLDEINWLNSWPILNGGRGPSDTPRIAPVAQAPDKSKHKERPITPDRLGKLIVGDEFNGARFKLDWTWVRQPDAATYGLENGSFRFNTQAADLYVDSNTASVLTFPAARGDYAAETRVRLSVPPEGCCFNYVQAGLVVYGDDDNFIKLVHASIWETRQTEFAKEVFPVPAGYPRYGNTVVGPPAEWTYLRVVKHVAASPYAEDTYTAYTSQDGENWVRGATWTHNLGANERIGLVAMGGSGFVANFDYLRMYELKPDKARE